MLSASSERGMSALPGCGPQLAVPQACWHTESASLGDSWGGTKEGMGGPTAFLGSLPSYPQSEPFFKHLVGRKAY